MNNLCGRSRDTRSCVSTGRALKPIKIIFIKLNYLCPDKQMNELQNNQ